MELRVASQTHRCGAPRGHDNSRRRELWQRRIVCGAICSENVRCVNANEAISPQAQQSNPSVIAICNGSGDTELVRLVRRSELLFRLGQQALTCFLALYSVTVRERLA